MNISRAEQRTLHALAQGGGILIERDDRGHVIGVRCVTRDGLVLTDCTLTVWRKLRAKGLIASLGGGPYRVNREGLARMRAQLDNRVSARADGETRPALSRGPASPSAGRILAHDV